MKITHVECFTVDLPGAEPPFAWRRGLLGSPRNGEAAVVRISTDDGAVGAAIATRPGVAAAAQDIVDRVLRGQLVGLDPLQRELLWHRIWEIDRTEELPLPMLGVIDSALWDLAGRLVDQPVWQLLGGFRTEIPAYASTVTFGDTSEYLDVAQQCLEVGYTAIKLHAWGDARADAALCQALRDQVGPDVPLMYDGSAGFDLPDAVYLGHALAEAGYYWYEEPIREFSVSAYRALAAAVRVPLLVAETSDGAHMNSADFIASGAATFGVRTGASTRGGITGSMRIAHLADAFRVRAEVLGGDMEARHLCMAIPNTTFYESLVTSNPVRRPMEVDADGLLRAPSGPGIGLPPHLDYPPTLADFVGLATARLGNTDQSTA